MCIRDRTLTDLRKAIMHQRNRKIVKLETNNMKVLLIDIDRFIKDDKQLRRIYHYKPSNLLKTLLIKTGN